MLLGDELTLEQIGVASLHHHRVPLLRLIPCQGRLGLGDPRAITLEHGTRLLDLNLILGQGGFGLGEGGLERPWIDGEEEIALVDVLAFLDVDAHELAADLGLDGDHRIRLDAPDGPDFERNRLPLD